MSSTDSHGRKSLRQVAEILLNMLPAGALSASVIESLQAQSLDGFYRAGVELLAAGHVDAAAMMFESLLDQPNIGSWVISGLAKVAVARRDWPAAVNRWLDCLERFPERREPWWLLELARAERELGQHADAEVHLRQCRDQFPAFVPGAVALAHLLGAVGRLEECVTAWQAAVEEFPAKAQAWWFLELSRAESRLGRHGSAEAHLRRCCADFPHDGAAAAALAEFLRVRGRHEEAVAAWQTALDQFSATAQPWWFLGAAASCRELGRGEDVERVMDRMEAQFPNAPETLERRAAAAAKSEDWELALERWTACIARSPHREKPHWLDGQAKALFRLWRVEEALAVWLDCIERFPNAVAARISLAEAARELGHWATVRRCFADLIANVSGEIRPEWLGEQARSLIHERQEQAAALAIRDLEERFPDSPVGSHLAIAHSFWLDLGVDVMLPQIESAVRRFPAERSLQADHVRVLLASGRLEDAERTCRELEAQSEDQFSLISRWLVLMDREGDSALRGAVHRAVAEFDWQADSGLAVGEFLLTLWSPWAAELARQLLAGLAARFPRRIAIACAHARALIAVRSDALALRLIDSIPAACQTREMLELRAWAAYARGNCLNARELWTTNLAQNYFPAIHSPEPRLELLSAGREYTPIGGVSAFINVRNEMAHLPAFLKHHRAIGVGRFVFVDNMSTDDTAAFLRDQPDVILYRTPDAFQTSGAGMRWINLIRERHGQGGWCLYLDADEALIYPGWETAPLDRLTAYLDADRAEGVAAFMLDVYPERFSDAAGTPTTHDDCRYYDGGYEWIGQPRAPYLQPTGGVRSRLFKVNEILHKVPMVRHGAGSHINSHCTTPLRFAQVTAVLLHYKLLNLARRFKPSPPAGGNPFMANRTPDLMRRHVRYAARMDRLLDGATLLTDLTETLAPSMVLADRGLMQAPPEYREYLAQVRRA